MRRFSDRHGLSTVSELNVTPLLDLAFVLLIIFMITTPLMDNSLDLVLPRSDTPEQPVEPEAVQTISIGRDEHLKYNGRAIEIEELAGELVALHAEKPQTAVVIRSHRELPVQTLVNVMTVVQRAKITKLGVVTNPEE